MKLMVIEDNALNLKLIKLIINDLGFDTFYAENGRIAIESVDSISPDIVLCDIQMPEIDGIHVLKYIRSKPMIANCKVIAITAHALIGDRERFIKMGFDEYISKPFDTRQFRDLMREYQYEFEQNIEKENF